MANVAGDSIRQIISASPGDAEEWAKKHCPGSKLQGCHIMGTFENGKLVDFRFGGKGCPWPRGNIPYSEFISLMDFTRKKYEAAEAERTKVPAILERSGVRLV